MQFLTINFSAAIQHKTLILVLNESSERVDSEKYNFHYILTDNLDEIRL